MREKLEALMRQAGGVILSARHIDQAVSEKEGPANFVTTYDVAVQHLLREGLMSMRPDAQFVGEEEGDQGDVSRGTSFIVDPIDGTTNFIKGCNSSAISVAMLEDGQPVVGAVYDPYRDEFFYAEKGKGATLNGRPIHVSEENLSQSLVCMGTSPYIPELHARTFRLTEKVMELALDLRRSGSAVIDLCQVARGAAGLMFEFSLYPWDHAAAGFIITEAGGVITQMDGSPIRYDRRCSALAGTKQAHADFLAAGLHKI